MPIAVLTLPGVIRVGPAVSKTCPRMCLTEVFPYEPVIAITIGAWRRRMSRASFQ